MKLATLIAAAAVITAHLAAPDTPTDSAVVEAVYQHPDAWRFDRPAEVTTTAARIVTSTTSTTTSSTTTTTVPTPIPGDCASWAPVILARGGTADDVTFFVDSGILARESGCGRDNLNESSGDSGVCQINPVHNAPGYFGGLYYDRGGWLYALHGLWTRKNVDSVEWLDACITLRTVCGDGPWIPPYSCANRRLP